MYNYNSNHKIITALLLITGIALFHFLNKADEEDLYYETGQVKSVGSKKNALNHGLWTWYYSNGTRMMQGHFDEGKRIGLWKRFDAKERVSTTFHYKDNHLEGLYTTYDTSGVIIQQLEYRKDTIYKRLTVSEFREP